MPQPSLLEDHRILMRGLRETQPVKSINRSLRPCLQALHAAGYVHIAFDWQAFDTVASLTADGAKRLKADQEAHRTPL